MDAEDTRTLQGAGIFSSRSFIMTSKKPGATDDSGPPPGRDRQGSVEEALDEALEETFPGSDPINLDQWTEMRREEQMRHDEQKTRDEAAKPAAPEAEEEIDRIKRYLSGPTSFSA
jgi:hypothetical protein